MSNQTTPTLLCLHGMACSGAVFNLFADAWAGPIVAPDLAGHGSAARLPTYGIDRYASDIEARFPELFAEPAELVLFGHSMGGAVALELARTHSVRAVLAIGVVTVWEPERVAQMSSVADKRVRWFDDQEAAEAWFLKVSGMFGLIDVGTTIAASGVVEDDGRWRLRADPETYRSGPPPSMADQLADIECLVRLGRGGNDEMVPVEQVAPYDSNFMSVPGAGHSPHAEVPSDLAAAITAFIS
ncbi:MAG: pimeloyl-ACP methyl ester carboxylesterase [Acidimicrobiales bacterium]|jgi:pimeloyl-ACP methyl ester carboxylesterase